jgi:hypothetical protein
MLAILYSSLWTEKMLNRRFVKVFEIPPNIEKIANGLNLSFGEPILKFSFLILFEFVNIQFWFHSIYKLTFSFIFDSFFNAATNVRRLAGCELRNWLFSVKDDFLRNVNIEIYHKIHNLAKWLLWLLWHSCLSNCFFYKL